MVAIEPEAKKLVRELRHTEFPRSTIRRLQQYSVAVRMREFAILSTAGAIEMIHDEFSVLCNVAAYHDELGLCVDDGDALES